MTSSVPKYPVIGPKSLKNDFIGSGNIIIGTLKPLLVQITSYSMSYSNQIISHIETYCIHAAFIHTTVPLVFECRVPFVDLLRIRHLLFRHVRQKVKRRQTSHRHCSVFCVSKRKWDYDIMPHRTRITNSKSKHTPIWTHRLFVQGQHDTVPYI